MIELTGNKKENNGKTFYQIYNTDGTAGCFVENISGLKYVRHISSDEESIIFSNTVLEGNFNIEKSQIGPNVKIVSQNNAKIKKAKIKESVINCDKFEIEDSEIRYIKSNNNPDWTFCLSGQSFVCGNEEEIGIIETYNGAVLQIENKSKVTLKGSKIRINNVLAILSNCEIIASNKEYVLDIFAGYIFMDKIVIRENGSIETTGENGVIEIKSSVIENKIEFYSGHIYNSTIKGKIAIYSNAEIENATFSKEAKILYSKGENARIKIIDSNFHNSVEIYAVNYFDNAKLSILKSDLYDLVRIEIKDDSALEIIESQIEGNSKIYSGKIINSSIKENTVIFDGYLYDCNLSGDLKIGCSLSGKQIPNIGKLKISAFETNEQNDIVSFSLNKEMPVCFLRQYAFIISNGYEQEMLSTNEIQMSIIKITKKLRTSINKTICNFLCSDIDEYKIIKNSMSKIDISNKISKKTAFMIGLFFWWQFLIKLSQNDEYAFKTLDDMIEKLKYNFSIKKIEWTEDFYFCYEPFLNAVSTVNNPRLKS